MYNRHASANGPRLGSEAVQSHRSSRSVDWQAFAAAVAAKFRIECPERSPLITYTSFPKKFSTAATALAS